MCATGADPTGTKDSTAALQAAIDAAAAHGQPVVVPAGTFLLTSPLKIRNGTHIHVAAGGVLRSSPDLDVLSPGWANASGCPVLHPVRKPRLNSLRPK